MTSNEFFKKYGLEESKKAHALSINAGDEDLQLKKLIESHIFSEKVEGVKTVKVMISTMDESKLQQMNISFKGESLGCFKRQELVNIVNDVESCQ